MNKIGAAFAAILTACDHLTNAERERALAMVRAYYATNDDGEAAPPPVSTIRAMPAAAPLGRGERRAQVLACFGPDEVLTTAEVAKRAGCSMGAASAALFRLANERKAFREGDGWRRHRRAGKPVGQRQPFDPESGLAGEILNALRTGTTTLSDMAAATKRPRNEVSARLTVLIARGLVVREGRATYRLAS